MTFGKPYLTGSFEEELDEYLRNNRRVSITPTRRTYIIPPPPDEYLVTFIGGPKNAQQEFLKRKDHPHIANDCTYAFSLQEPPGSFIKDQQRNATILVAHYNLFYIPLSQTPFTDAQCICAVFVN